MSENCLDGMQCPKCDSLEPFRIRAECTALVYGRWVEHNADMEWNDESACWCENCGHEGTVKSFSRKGKTNDHS
jgi:hypothetical protein